MENTGDQATAVGQWEWGPQSNPAIYGNLANSHTPCFLLGSSPTTVLLEADAVACRAKDEGKCKELGLVWQDPD